MFALDLAADRARALQLTPVSRETAARLDRFVDSLLPWHAADQPDRAARRIPTIWTRHIADSLQLLPLAPDAKCWVDLGSGAGFPGLVIACALADRAGRRRPSGGKQRQKGRLPARGRAPTSGARAIVHAVRIEDFVKNFDGAADVVTARALAPLDELLELAHPLLKTGAQGLFPKGQDVEG